MPVLEVELPVLHAGQRRAYNLIDPATGKRARFKAIRAGRRFGKTALGKTIASDSAIRGEMNGWFAPTYRYLSEPYNEIEDVLKPVKARSSKTEGIIKTIAGGQVDFWTLEDKRVGRGRRYHNVFIDEAAFTDNASMMDVWEQAIKPTLFDFSGSCYVLSNTNGNNPDNFLYKICNEPKYGFVQYHAPSWDNPLIPLRMAGEGEADWLARRELEFAKIKSENHPLVYQQEFAADFVDFGGEAFFSKDKLLWAGGQPAEAPTKCDYVFSVIDSATKTGKQNDGTAVVWCAVTNHLSEGKLVVLGWDYLQMSGDLLINWLPTVIERGQLYAQQCGARAGFVKCFIEDQNSGSILIQQAQRQGLPVLAIDSKLTSYGKDERAISVSSKHHQGMAKLSREAFEHTLNFKGSTRNHLMAQIVGFKIGDKDAAKRQDDLLDAYVYALALSLGDSRGW